MQNQDADTQQIPDSLPDSLEELLAGWDGEYPEAEDLEGWENMRPVGAEL